MIYKDKIKKLTENIFPELVDFSAERTWGRMPTQVSSEFLTNKEQGDWAENTLLKGINESSDKYIAVFYGKNDNINAGDRGFKEFYENYQKELDIIGKRPDILIFDKLDYPFDTTDISGLSMDELDTIVPKAKCAIEVRSSSYLIEKYELETQKTISDYKKRAKELQLSILNNYRSLLIQKDMELYNIIEGLSEENMQVISFRNPSWKSSADLQCLSSQLKELKSCIGQISKRNYLSITPKVEDIKLVYTWVQRYNVPHFYVQVFFDRAFGISFEKILSLIGNPDLEGREYFIESDVKNQGKTTIKINAWKEIGVIDSIKLPSHHSKMKELDKGRVLFYVKFDDSEVVVNKMEFERLTGVRL